MPHSSALYLHKTKTLPLSVAGQPSNGQDYIKMKAALLLLLSQTLALPTSHTDSGFSLGANWWKPDEGVKAIFQPKIKIMKWKFQDMILGVYQGHPCCQGWPCPPSLRSGTLNVLQVPPFLTPLLDTLLIEISTRNFQGILLGVKKHNSWRQEQPCPPCLRSGTLNVLQVPPFLTPPSWHTSNWDINTKFSGYLPWGKKT